MNKATFVTAAIAGLMLAGCASSTKSNSTGSTTMAAEGECHGVNACKGKGDCGGDGYSCAGKNSCKGKGWLKLSKSDCDAKGGTFKNNM